ncbi:hypothetical protein ANN_24226 [Periplaneta americana]|uniref:Retropepsins domain-containing protein n=1 Tax=Periplaneta americana TaxID=6978 RepID=A0ABQ8S301_PERAM|nr:hypothetical protein ANN_24226 [Periplaneta americana]
MTENRSKHVNKQDGAPPHFHNAVRVYLNTEVSDRWLGRAGDRVFVPPLPRDLEELKIRIREAATTVTEDMLKRVWEEFDYRLDICRVTRGSRIESLDHRTSAATTSAVSQTSCSDNYNGTDTSCCSSGGRHQAHRCQASFHFIIKRSTVPLLPGYHYNRDCPVRKQRRIDPARHIPISSPVAQMALAPDEEETVPRIDIRMGTLAATAVVDSAASRNIINAAKIPNGSTIRARQDVIHLAQREQTMATQGEAEIPVTLAGTTKPINFLVAPELRADAILGNTWLRDMSAQLDYRQGQLRLGNGAVVPLINNPRTGEGTKPEPQRDAAPGGRQQPSPPVKPVPGDPAKEERYQHFSGHVSGPPSQSGRKEDPLASRPLELHMLETGVTSDSHAPTAAEGICCSEEVPQVEDPLEKEDPGGSQTVVQDVADTRHKVTPPTATEGMPDPLRGGNPTSDGPYSEVTSNTDIPRYIRSPETTGTTNELSGPGCWRAVTTCKEAKPSPPNPDRPADTPTPSQTTPEAARSDAAAPLPVLPPQRRKRSGQPDQIAVCALAMCDQTERAIDASVVVPQSKRNKIVDTRSAFTNHDPNIQTKYDKHRLGPRPP